MNNVLIGMYSHGISPVMAVCGPILQAITANRINLNKEGDKMNQEDILELAKLCEKHKVQQITKGSFDTYLIRTDTELVVHHIKGASFYHNMKLFSVQEVQG